MTVVADKAIIFKCEYCGRAQWAEDTLDYEWFIDRYVLSDNINCENCEKENHVIMEL